MYFCVFFKQKTAYEMRISDWSSDVCSADLGANQVKVAVAHASKIEARLKEVPYLRDVRIAEALSYPTLDIDVDRDLAGQFGLTMQDITSSLVTATSSTRFTNKNLWIDPKSGLVFQTQVQIPEGIMSSEEKLDRKSIV